MLAKKRGRIGHSYARQALTESLAGIGARGWKREKVFVVRDDVSGMAGDGEFDERGIVGVAIESELYADRVDEFPHVQQIFEQVLNELRSLGRPKPGDLRVDQNPAVFSEKGPA